jgi:UrcA family protein
MKLTVIGIGVAALIGGTALAAPPISIIREPVRVQRVSFADLNLATSDGRAALDGRIRAAAHNVCERDGESSVEALVSARSCLTAAVAKARHQADAVGVGNRDVALGSAVVTVRGQ